MKSAESVFRQVTTALDYTEGGGLVTSKAAAKGGTRLHLFLRATEQVKVDAVYFAGDVPLVYFATREEFDPKDIAELHRRVWNDSRVPLLFVFTRSEVLVYDGFAIPTLDAQDLDSGERLVLRLRATTDALERLHRFRRSNLETGVPWAQEPDRFRSNTRCDQSLLSNLGDTRRYLVRAGLPDDVTQQLLARTILLIYLEHREVLTRAYYDRLIPGTGSLVEVLDDKGATYSLFDALADRFNGDLLPVSSKERQEVGPEHLSFLKRFLLGNEHVGTGQISLWPLYDFKVIPIQLISAIYEKFLRKSDAPPEGAHYTKQFMAELLMNEVLPWPSPDERDVPERPRVLDPACGSGVFLVEAYRRIVERWRFKNPRSRPTAGILRELMTECIFGIDIDARAIRIAAFSLYLAMLDYLEPKYIWEQVKFPRLKAEPGGDGNLYFSDAFNDSLPIHKSRFDVVVGNPPWGRDVLPASAAEYCRRRGHPVAKEIAHAFLWLASDLSLDGISALFCTSKCLFNRELPDVRFRRGFFRENHVQTVLNLSSLRFSGLFSEATAPTVALVYRRPRPKESSESILYCTPKRAIGGSPSLELTIDSADLKWVPRAQAEEQSDVWKALCWGTWRDLDLVRKIKASGPTLREFLESPAAEQWERGRGFQPYDPAKNPKADLPTGPKRDPDIARMRFIDASDVTRYIIEPSAFVDSYPNDLFVRKGVAGAYRGPHVLIKEGLSDWQFCSAFEPGNCTFRDTIFGISAPEAETSRLMALTVFLNSSAAQYFLFLTASTWGVERERVKPNEVLDLPASVILDPKAVKDLAAMLGRWGGSSYSEKERLEGDMDLRVFEAMSLTKNERVLVEDMLSWTMRAFHSPRDRVVRSRPSSAQLRAYAGAFKGVLDRVLAEGRQSAEATIYEGAGPLTVISFRLKGGKLGGTREVSREGQLEEVLGRLDRLLRDRESGSIFTRRQLKLFEKDAIHIVKPTEALCWTRTQAFKDADETLAESFAGRCRVPV
jgi:hypothetical protein